MGNSIAETGHGRDLRAELDRIDPTQTTGRGGHGRHPVAFQASQGRRLSEINRRPRAVEWSIHNLTPVVSGRGQPPLTSTSESSGTRTSCSVASPPDSSPVGSSGGLPPWTISALKS